MKIRHLDGIKGSFYISNAELVWMGISIGISLTLSLLIPFPISIVAIIGTFLLLNFYLRRRIIARMGGMMGTGMFRPGTQHKQIAHPALRSYLQNISGKNLQVLTCGQ
jgi:hypothetical protein